MKYYNLTADMTVRLLNIAIEIKKHTPVDVCSDKFFRVISNNSVKSACLKNKAVIRGIARKNKLSLSEYKELLTAIGIMLRNYAENIIKNQLEKRLFPYMNEYTFNVTAAELHNIAMGDTQNIWWNISASGNEYSIMRLKHGAGNNMFSRYGKSSSKVILGANTYCIQIGKCKCFISGKDVYCYPADMELFFIKREGNNFIGYSRNKKNLCA